MIFRPFVGYRELRVQEAAVGAFERLEPHDRHADGPAQQGHALHPEGGDDTRPQSLSESQLSPLVLFLFKSPFCVLFAVIFLVHVERAKYTYFIDF